MIGRGEAGFSVGVVVGTTVVGAADKFKVARYTVEGLELLVCYVEVDVLSHLCDVLGVLLSVVVSGQWS
ncbi:MAG TPA: hypothetical protein O0W87_04290 [Methanocorpusculum sp.]|nr:hypothetical protein [Methanocorpusculum sp.]